MDAGNASERHIEALPDEAAPTERFDWTAERRAGGVDDTRRPIGDIFVELGFISRAQLDAALEVQRARGGRIGEILVEQGSLTRIDLASALAEHWEPHPYAEEPERSAATVAAAARPAAEARPTQPAVPQPPRRARLRRSSRADALDEQLAQLEARLRGDVDRALAGHVEAVTLRLDRLETRLEAIETVESRLAAVSDLASELRVELTTVAQRTPPVDPSDRLRELSLRIDRAARDSNDRIGALATDLRTELAVRTAGLGDRLQAQLEEAAALQRRLAEMQEAAVAARTADVESAAELHVELGSLAGRLDELYGLRHADLQVGKAAQDRLAARLEDRIALHEAAADEAREEERAAERSLIEALSDLGEQLAAMAAKTGKKGKQEKRLRRSIDSLTEALAAVDAQLDAQATPSDQTPDG